MNMDKKTYQKYADARAPRSPMGKNCLNAFWIGGSICLLGQLLHDLYEKLCHMSDEDAGTLVSVSLIFLAVLLTALGVFDKIAKVAGAGTLVPITGFANAVVSPAIDSHAEGLILGVGAKIFTVAGPVLLYGTLAGTAWGILYWIATLL
ncbi:MAG: stage V sporulation protein AC [Clostridia bacterium]|nr:stage V sporulation protein AC [Clostridia bacterium]